MVEKLLEGAKMEIRNAGRIFPRENSRYFVLRGSEASITADLKNQGTMTREDRDQFLDRPRAIRFCDGTLASALRNVARKRSWGMSRRIITTLSVPYAVAPL
jgi:hypothetical protein